MIRGVVNSQLEAVVSLRVRGPNLAEADVDAVLDSGFSSSLALPSAVIESLGLERQSVGIAALVDGAICRFNVYSAELEWGNAWRPVMVYAIGEEMLLGMRLLAGHQVRMDVVPGGIVEISPL